jgi:hypothetical protein
MVGVEEVDRSSVMVLVMVNGVLKAGLKQWW